ncbi:hypothetical protein [Komagataeibacter sp. FNDCF1]|nr:hypothetical protein [Komagataeibacter sp. FNDCF1]MCE2565221.1 hypothetical protein [Komagataeibacter sp. FNDCF1]
MVVSAKEAGRLAISLQGRAVEGAILVPPDVTECPDHIPERMTVTQA